MSVVSTRNDILGIWRRTCCVRRTLATCAVYNGGNSTAPSFILYSLFFKRVRKRKRKQRNVWGFGKKFRKWPWKLVSINPSLTFVCQSEFLHYAFVFYFNILFCHIYSQIKWGERLNDCSYNDAFISVDVVDFSIQDRSPFEKSWYSHKFKRPGLEYEIGAGIHSGIAV